MTTVLTCIENEVQQNIVESELYILNEMCISLIVVNGGLHVVVAQRLTFVVCQYVFTGFGLL